MNKLIIMITNDINSLGNSEGILIKKTNRNFTIFQKIDNILIKNNLDWNWLINNSEINSSTIKNNFRGYSNIGIDSITKIALLLIEYINSPRDIMDENCVILNCGHNFKLNIREIKEKYSLTIGNIATGTGIARTSIKRVMENGTTQIRPDDIQKYYNYFISVGVELRNPLDLIYFPLWDEEPLHFINKTKSKNILLDNKIFFLHVGLLFFQIKSFLWKFLK
jgi:hypothetical protein